MAFPNELDYLEPLIKKNIEKEGNEFLLGLLDLTDREYEFILNYASALIKKEKLLYKKEKNMIISVALVFFAIKDFQGTQFWDEFSQKIHAEEMQVQKACKPAFEKFCDVFNLYFYTGRKNKGYVTSILIHAIIPITSIDKFLEFLEDIYFKDLEETYDPKEVEQLVEYMHRLFSRFLEEDDIHIDIQGSKMTIARQQLPKSFRLAFVNSAGIVAPIIEKYLFYINELNYSLPITYNHITRFDNYFRFYEKNRSKIQGAIKRKSDIVDKGMKKYKTAQFTFKDDSLSMFVPKQIIDSEYMKDAIYLNVFNEEELIESRELRLTKSRLLFKTEVEEIKLLRFCKNIRYEIKTNASLIYDSNQRLYRDYLIFNMDADEVAPGQLRSENYRIICDSQYGVEMINGEKSSRTQSNYRVHTVFLKDDSILNVGSYTITPNNKQLKTELNERFKYSDVIGIGADDSSCDVYSCIPYLQLIIPEEKSIEDYVITVNGDNYLLYQYSDFSLSKLTDGSGTSIAHVKIMDSLLDSLKLYSIMIRLKGNLNPLISEKLYIIPKLQYAFDKPFYYKDSKAKLISFSVDEALSCNEKLPLTININKHNDVKVTIEKSSVQLRIVIPKFSWQIGEFYSNQNVTDLWYQSVRNAMLTVSYSESISTIFLVDEKRIAKLEGKRRGDHNLFDLNDYLLVERSSPLTIGVKIGEEQITVVTIHYQPLLKHVTIEYYESDQFVRGLFIDGVLIGEGDLKAQLLNSMSGNLLKEYDLKHNFNMFDQNIFLEYGKYEVKIILSEEDDFFGTASEDRVMCEEQFIVGDPFIVLTHNNVLKVQKCNTYDGEYHLDNFYLQNIRLSKTTDYYEADGFYYVTDWDTKELRKWYFTKYNPFMLKIRKEHGNNYELEIEDKDRDGLIYDSYSKHVNPKYIGNDDRFKLIDTINIKNKEV